ncbi:hypothetical protein D9Q98_010372 [Chlorella vulgaris]|uniref:Carrier domain-containing protein n=1 Tax=Chlorella vulgaris TaxID=3077 RepID=A0A9D4TS28_CHLVU|nr:hypothetical protein D9Q98_010372 [Chlorella vulgaris]
MSPSSGRPAGSTLLEVFQALSAKQPAALALRWLDDSGNEVSTLSYGELESQVAAVSEWLLKSLRLKPGDRVVLSFPPGLKFLVAFLSCLAAGIIAVPIYPPSPATFKKDSVRLALIAKTAGATIALTSTDYNLVVTGLKWKSFFTGGGGGAAGGVEWKAVPDKLFSTGKGRRMKQGSVKPSDVAFLQFTSGSTGDPKGVMVTHGNILHNLSAIYIHLPQRPGVTMVSWMPQYHDFGLIVMMLLPLYVGYNSVVMSPFAFLKDPMVWLRTITKYRGEITAAPNFAFTRCVLAWQRMAPEKRPKLDLSSLIFACNAAEPIRPSTLTDFQETFGPMGLKPTVMCPAYGLAEHVVYAGTMAARPQMPTVIDPDTGFVACAVVGSNADVDLQLMGFGGEEEGREPSPVAPGATGEVWLSSPSKAAGYWGRPDVTKETFHNLYQGREYLRTGDLAYIKDGLLYITGRLKDVIIVGGRNLYPQDVEVTVEAVSKEIRPGCVASFQLQTGLGRGDAGSAAAMSPDQIGIVAEVRAAKLDTATINGLFAGIRQAVTAEHGLTVARIALVKARTIPKTTSGKIRRSTCKDLMLEGGKLDVIPGGMYDASDAKQAAEIAGMGAEWQPPTDEEAAALRPVSARNLLALDASPADRLRAELADIISGATGIPLSQLAPDAPLAELGVGSLQALQIVGEVQEKYGVALDPTLWFEGLTLTQMVDQTAELMKGGGGGGAEAAAAAAAAAAADAAAAAGQAQPASFNQAQMFVLDSKGAGASLNIPFALDLAGELQMPALLAALDVLAARHDTLRARFTVLDGAPAVVYAPAPPAPGAFAPVLARAPLPSGGDAAVAAAVAAEGTRHFSLVDGPLLRLLLLESPQRNVLVVTTHHSISDGWSVRILMNDLAAAYSACVRGEQPSLPPLPATYAAYAAWQHAQAEQGAWDADLEYWSSRLLGAPSYLALPYRKAGGGGTAAAAAGPGAAVPLFLPRDVVAGLSALAGRGGTTLFSVLAAAVSALLMRYADQEDVTLGIPFSGREAGPAPLLRQVGYYVNTLVLRLTADSSQPFDQLVAAAKAEVQAATAHGTVPYQQVATKAVKRGSTPFQVYLVHQDYRLLQVAPFEGLQVEPILDIDLGSSQFDAAFEMLSTPEGDIKGRLVYNSEKLAQPTMAAMAAALGALCAAAAADPATPLAALPLLGTSVRSSLAALSAAPYRDDYLKSLPVHAAFQQHAKRTPAAPCLIFEGETLSYGQVEARVNSMARALTGMGVGRGTPVGLMLDRSFELVIAMLAAMKAGGCYVPLDPEYPDDRLVGYMEDSKAVVLVTQQQHADRAAQLGGEGATWKTVLVDQIPTNGSEAAPTPAAGASSEDTAYIEFTSGSTGRPKGVAVSHRALADFLCWTRDTWKLGPEDASLLLISIQFDPHVACVFTPLFVGGRLVIPRPGGQSSADYIMGLVAEHGVSFLPSVPTFGWEHFKTRHASKCGKLKAYLFGGEPLPPELVGVVQNATPQALPSHNVYGPTEATILITMGVFTEDNVADGIHIGRPNTNAHTYIVDSSLRPVPPGVPGELLLSGPRLAAGYVGRPDLTADKFVPNPCLELVKGDIPAGMERFYEMAYHTGDLVRWRPDGNLDFLGRIDRQVKVNGVRIELGEVEAALGSAAGVSQAVATAMLDPGIGAKRLVGYVTPGDVSPAAVVAHCRTLLVPAMVPSAIVALDSFPLLPNGKIDMAGMPVPDWRSLQEEEVEYVAPATQTEERLHALWLQVLGREDPVSTIADFLTVGGTSMLVIRLASAIQVAFGLSSPLNRLHELSTIQAMAKYVDEMVLADAGSTALAPRQWPDDRLRPASLGQEQLYVVCQFDQTGSLYNEPLLVDMRGTVDVPRLEAALLATAQRQEALRSCYVQTPQGLAICLLPELKAAPVRIVDLRGKVPEDAGQDQELVSAELKADSHRSFNLLGGEPLWRGLVLRLSDKRALVLFTLHHAVMDGWSIGVFMADLTAMYNADTSRPQPPLDYSDYAAWQREWLARPQAEAQRDWWRDQLKDAPALLQLPTDFQRPAVPTGKGGSRHVLLDVATTAAAKAFARESGSTLYNLFLSVYRLLLCRLSGEDGIVIGTTQSNRPANTENLMGYFLNVLPLYGKVWPTDSLRELIKRELQTLQGAMAHGEIPFDQIVDACGVQRSPAHNPLVQALITTEEEGFMPILGMEGLEPTQVTYYHHEGSKMDMNLAFFPHGEQYTIGIEYNSDLFTPATAQSFLDGYVALLTDGLANPAKPVGTLALLSAAQKQELYTTLASGPLRPHYVPEGGATLTIEAFEREADAEPGRPCLVFNGTTLSYGEVNTRANRLARTLVQLGVSRDVGVGLMMDRSFELVIAMLAAMKAGGCYVPLDPEYPDDRLVCYMEDSKAAVLITQREHNSRAQQLGGADAVWKVLVVEDYDFTSGDASNLPADRVQGDSLAYVIFTSGSTGRPKGVMIDHTALIDFLLYNLDYYSVTKEDTCLLSVTINFDPHVMQLFTGLIIGARLVIARPGGHVDPEYMAGLMHAYDVSFYNTVPALGLEYYKCPAISKCTSLRSAIFSGEAMPTELVELIYRNVPKQVTVYNAYGPTEATVMATNLKCTAGMKHMSIGYPEANMHCYIVDRFMQPVPVGVPGELLLSGPRLARGYIGRADLTADKFVHNPCYDDVAGLLPDPLRKYFQLAYRTGDLCRFKANGEIDFQGRIDNQVKINGVRMELGEVEVALGSAPGVAQAVATARLDPAINAKRLVGYVMPATVDVAEVVAHCRSQLVPAMVPSAIVALDTFPLLPNGKVNVKALPEPTFGVSQEYVGPATDLEAALQEVWTEVLGLPKPISVTADFFMTGGTSLQVFRVVAGMQKRSGGTLPALPPTLIHTHRTIRATAAAIAAMSADGGGDAAAAALGLGAGGEPIAPRSWPSALRPLSANQEQMWLLFKASPGSSAYNMPLVVSSEGGVLDAGRLQAALDAVSARHEVLRMHYVEGGDGIAQAHIAPAEGYSVPLTVTKAGSNGDLAATLRAATTEPFDLAAGPLLRALLLVDGRKASTLAVVMHHAVGDAWSQGILLRELAAAYNAAGQRGGAAVVPPPLELQYSDYAAWQQEQLAGPAAAAARAYWQKTLAGAPSVLQLPTLGGRPTSPQYTAGAEAVQIPTEVMAKLGAAAHGLGVNTQALLLACLQALLCRYSGQEEVVVGVPVAGRDRPETHPVIGYFINSVPILGGLGDTSGGDGEGPTLAAMARAASQALTDALAHSLLPLTQLAAAVRAERILGANPVFQVLLQYLPDADSVGLELTGAGKVSLVTSPPAPAKAKMDLLFNVGGDGLLTIEYMTELYDAAMVRRLAGAYLALLSAAASAPYTPAIEVELATPDDERLLAAFVPGEMHPEYLSAPFTIHQFEDVAAAHPGRVALEFEGREMTYGELNTQANLLAHKLVQRGIQNDVLLGVMMMRSFELVISILATLKAGGGYLPLDPAYPDDRLAIYTEDADVSVMLVSSDLAPRAAALLAAAGKASTPVLLVDQEVAAAASAADPGNLERSRVQAEGACYSIFTSGSTGRPKGAQLLNGGLRDLICWLISYFQCGIDDVVLMTNTVSFDAHVLQLYPPLVVGAKLVLASPKGHLDPDYMADLICSTAATGLIFTVPTLMREWVASLGDRRPPSVRMWGIGGENVSLADVALMQKVFPNIRGPMNSYGPTEVTAVTVQHTFEQGATTHVLGKPDHNVHAYVVDAKMRPVPVGVPGELLLSGPRLGRGYIGRPDLTAEKFIQNPCYRQFIHTVPPELQPHYRLAYRTGDLVRWRPDGYIDFMGRIDRQVKINGVRLELGEVEITLSSFEGVTQAVAAVAAAPDGSKRLVGYVTPGGVDIGALLAHCRSQLVPAMVPSAIVALDTFPVMPNGKIDTKSLPPPDFGPGGGEEYVAASTPLQEQLQGIWMKVLGLPADEPLSVEADFFAAGGTSLQVFRVQAAMQAALGLAVPPTLIHTSRTVAATAAELEKLRSSGGGEGGAAAPLPPVPAHSWPDNVRPLSANQEQMWVLYKSGGQTSAYNIPLGLTIESLSGIDVAALQRALDAVAFRHETLRMRFDEQADGSVVGVVTPPESASIPLATSSASSADALAAAVQAEARAPFDLQTAPLVRAALVQGPGGSGVLVLVLHHSIGDGWSMDILLSELQQAYTAAAAVVPQDASASGQLLPILELQYADFAAWQKEQLGGAAATRQRAWWRKALGGAPQVLQLPWDRQRPEAPSFNGGNYRLTVEPGLMARLAAVASGLGVNMQAVLLAGLKAVLSKYSAQDDIVVGVPTAGRDLAETQPMIGYFINTTAVRTQLEPADTFAALAKRVSGGVLAALERNLLPFSEVVTAAGVARSPGVNPIFQVMFQYLPDSQAFAASFGEAACGLYDMPGLGQAKVDIAVIVNGEGRIVVDYMAELFDEPTIARIMASYASLLSSMAAAPEAPVAAADLFPAGGLHSLLTKFAPGEARPDHLAAPLVHVAFEQHAAAEPTRPCLVFEGTTLSYGEANERANILAHALAAAGAVKGTPIGLMLDRSPDLLVAMLAAWKAGGVYVPLDPEYPDDRLAGYMEDSKAAVLVTQQQHAERAAKLGGKAAAWKALDINTVWAAPATPETSAHPPPAGAAVSPEDTAYIEFTSGSTGRPKGVVIHHRGFAAYCCALRDTLGLTPDTCSLLTISVNFDPHLRQTWPHLFCGGRVVISRPGGHTDPEYVMGLVADHAVSFLYTVPALGLLYYETAAVALCTSLLHAAFSGEALPPVLVALVASSTPNKLPCTNVYGPTECTLSSTTSIVSPGQQVTIGRPDPNVHCYVVDSQLRAVPVGVPGELLISGPRLGKGYIGRPDLTAAAYVPSPLYDDVKELVPSHMRQYYQTAYRTGDLVRWQPGGNLEYLGRIDRQVKIDGVRVELGEVESVLGSAPGVTRAVAVAMMDPGINAKRLVGYVTPADASVAAMTAHCKERLVAAMVPSVIVPLAAFPLLPNGKVDQKSLPPPDFEGGAGAGEFVPAEGPLEERLAAIWMRVLGRTAPISATADFFAIGGTSLLCFRLVAAISRELAAPGLPATFVHAQRTIQAQSIALEEEYGCETLLTDADGAGMARLRSKAGARLLLAPGKWDDNVRPLSANQQQMWVLFQNGAHAAYNIPVCLRLRGVVDVAALQTALNYIAARHENLRLAFHEVHDTGEVVGIVQPSSGYTVPLKVTDLSAAGAEALDEAVVVEATRAFDLRQHPLLRAVLFLGSGNDATLAMTVHHAVGDAWSSGVLLTELTAAYNAFRGGKGFSPVTVHRLPSRAATLRGSPSMLRGGASMLRGGASRFMGGASKMVGLSGPPSKIDRGTAAAAAAGPLEPLGVQYADFVVWQLRTLEQRGEALRSWWQEALRGAPSLLQLPIDRPRPEEPTCAAGTHHLFLPPETMSRLAQLAGRLAVNMQALLLAGVMAVLSRYSGQEDVVVGVPTAGRDLPETQSLIGYFVNTVAVRAVLEEDDTFESLVKRVSTSQVDALQNSALPFADVVSAVGAKRARGINPLFQVMFQYFPDGASMQPALQGLQVEMLPAPPLEQAKVDISIYIDGKGRLGMDYMAELFDAATIQAIGDSMQRMLEGAAAAAATNIYKLPILGQANKAQLAKLTSGDIRPHYVLDGGAALTVERFERVAAADPNRPCLKLNGAMLSYGEVNARANRLAHWLAGAGVGRDIAVGVMLDRSFELVIAMLAAMKAGGCFVPLDPEYPDDRLAGYMEDSKAAVLVTRSGHADRAAQLGGEAAVWKVLVCEEFDFTSGDASNLPTDRVQGDALAYVIFTSGSTGRPKGVMIDHIALNDFLLYNLDYYEIDADSVFLLSVTINFDPFIMQMWTPLIAGAQLVIARPGGHVDPEYMADLLVDERITFFNTVPALGLEYYKCPAVQNCTSLKTALFMGEALPIELVELVYRNVPEGVTVVNAYGPTEATVMATNLKCWAGQKHMSIGYPEANMHCYVVDRFMQPVPVGVPGELLLSGPRLARGYIGRADLTADKFVPNPCYDDVVEFVPEPLRKYFKLVYRTGDLVRFKANGEIDCLGRIDNQIKINGVRMELGEVETALGTAPGVTQAVAVAVMDVDAGQKKLVGYVTPGDVSPSDVLDHCRTLLVPAMVPSVVVAMEAFPLLPNGKVATRALPPPVYGAAADAEYVAPTNPTEQVIQTIWMDVLGITDPISIDADYFDIGGSSIKAGIINARIRKYMELDELPGNLILTNRTIRKVALALSAGGGQKELRATPTRMLAGRATKRVFGSLAVENALAARMNATDLELGQHMPHAVPLTRLPYALYMVVSVIFGLLTTLIAPLCTATIVSLMALIQAEPSPKSGYWNFLIGPAIYLGLLLLMFCALPIIKWLLFPRRMRPGVYPLYGWVYLRWTAYQAIQRRVMWYLTPHIGGTPVWNMWLRSLGARIGQGCVIDTNNINEPDLISIGHNVLVAEDAFVSAATIVPPGFVDENAGCLIFSTALVGDNCVLGRRSVVPAGSRLAHDKLLRPYAAPNHLRGVLDLEEGRKLYPHFYPERHMRWYTHGLTSLIGSALNTMSYIPGAVLSICVVCWVYNLTPGLVPYEPVPGVPSLFNPFINIIPVQDFVAVMYAALGFATRGTTLYFKIIMLPIAGTLASGVVLTPVTMFVQFLFNLVWKWTMLGRLSPGRNLAASQSMLLRYRVFLNLQRGGMWMLSKQYFHSTLVANSLLRAFGAKLGYDSHVDGITEYDAVEIGNVAVTGGNSSFQAVDEDGIVNRIAVQDFASFGHTTFFPGSSVGFASIVGNETSVHVNRTVPPQHNLQGDLLYPGGASTTPDKDDDADSDKESAGSEPKDIEAGGAAGGKDEPPARVADFDIFAPTAPPSGLWHKIKACGTAARVVMLTLAMDAGTGAACWSPASVALASFMAFLKQDKKWGVGELIALTVPLVVLLCAVGLCCLVVWMNFHTLLWRGKQLWKKSSASGKSLRVRMLGLIEGKIQTLFDAFKGTPTFNVAMSASGWGVAPESIIFGSLSQEMSLFHGGKGLVIEPGAVMSTHYIQSGRLFYVPVTTEEYVWVQARTRTLAAPAFGDHSRILPASMILPNEEVPAATVWGGIPANPVAKVAPPQIMSAVEAGRRSALEAKDTVLTLQPDSDGGAPPPPSAQSSAAVLADIQEVMVAGKSGALAAGPSTRRGALADRKRSAVTFRLADPTAYAGATAATSRRQLQATAVAGTTFRMQAVPEESAASATAAAAGLASNDPLDIV